MTQNTIDVAVQSLNNAWQDIEFAINAAYDEGYTGLIWQLKQVQLSIENLERDIIDKEYGDDDE